MLVYKSHKGPELRNGSERVPMLGGAPPPP